MHAWLEPLPGSAFADGAFMESWSLLGVASGSRVSGVRGFRGSGLTLNPRPKTPNPSYSRGFWIDGFRL